MITQEDFLEKMVDLLDTEKAITMESTLENIEEWDSLSLVSFLAMANSWGKSVKPINVRNATKIADLYDLVRN